jgi:hypothetical protein
MRHFSTSLFLAAILASGTLVACKNQTQFSSRKPITAAELPPPPTTQPAATDSTPQTTTPAAPAAPVIPESAVTKGSFSAWTEPPSPRAMENYWIVIRVKLPSDIGEYSRNDLSGQVVGTDMYVQSLSAMPGASQIDKWKGPPENFFTFSGGAELRIGVPGAYTLVQDTINIRSAVLKEQQTLTLIFR